MDRSLVPRVELVPFLDDDVPLVEGWLRSEHLRRSWIDTEEAILDVRDRSRRGTQRTVVVDDEPVGFLQWERVSPPEWAAVGLDVPEGAIDVEILIGTGENSGRGIGSAAIATVVEELGSHVLVATTSVSNLPSRRAFQKAGFTEREQFYEPGAGRMVLMVRPPR